MVRRRTVKVEVDVDAVAHLFVSMYIEKAMDARFDEVIYGLCNIFPQLRGLCVTQRHDGEWEVDAGGREGGGIFASRAQAAARLHTLVVEVLQ